MTHHGQRDQRAYYKLKHEKREEQKHQDQGTYMNLNKPFCFFENENAIFDK